MTGLREHLLVTGGIDGLLCYWNANNGKLAASIKPDKPDSDILCLDYTRDAARLAAAGKRRSIRLYDDERRTLLGKLRSKGQAHCSGHTNRVSALRFEESGKLLVSASWDLTMKVWDIATGTVVRSIFGPEVTGDAIDVCGDYILAGSHRSKDALQIWSLSYGKLVETVEWDPGHPGDSSLIFSAVFEKAGDKFFAACGSGRNEARVFEKTAGNLYTFSCGVIGLPSTCSSLDFSYKENLLAVGSCDGVCRIFDKVDKSKRDTLLFADPYVLPESKSP